MAFRDRLERVTDQHYVLPRLGGMRTEVHAFLSAALLEQTDEVLWQQVARAASYPGMIGLYLMPDTHLGYGIPVGGVAVTEDVIIQAGSGYDISCGVIHLRVDELHAADVADEEKRRRWIREVESRIATGVGSHRPRHMPRFSETQVDDILRYGAKPLGVATELCERQYIPVDDAPFDSERITRARDKAKPQLGSVGGGNHFVEMQVDRDDGSVWVMIHCGSRGYGWQTANHYFYAGAALRGLPQNRREESWLRFDEPLGREYWAHHNSAANYAVANRHVIVRGVQRGARGRVLRERRGVLRDLAQPRATGDARAPRRQRPSAASCIARARRVRSPPVIPISTDTVWSTTGHPCLVPGSMYQGAAILYPLDGAYASGCSVNHGSGRVMARGAAKRNLAAVHDKIDAEMRDVVRTLGGVEIRGIVGNTERTPLDECAHVYKDLDAVLGVLEAEGIARVAHRLYPVANIKGTD